MSSRKRILFVCVENANRSQIAEAFARIHARELALEVEAASAGSKPAAAVNPRAIASMAEIGYDLSSHRPKPLSDVEGRGYDVVVTMGCGDACPTIRARRRVEWNVPDPRSLEPIAFAQVRDAISAKVLELVQSL